MLFVAFVVLAILLQVCHRRLLRQLLPDRVRPGITAALILLHIPLALYMTIRLSGHGAFLPWLRPLARAGAYFQMFTLMNLVIWAGASLVWRLRRPPRPRPGQPPEDPARRRFLRQTSVLGVGLASYGVVHGAREAHADPEIVRLDLAFPDLPAGLDGLRIAQLSDLHAGPLVHADQVARWRLLTQAERPELLLVTGDFVDSLPEEAQMVSDAFKGFPAPLGRFAILGNHDYFTDPRPIWRILEAGGFRFLENRSAVIERNGARLALVGLQDPMAKHGHFQDIRYGPGPSPQLATQGLDPALWRICLSHRPSDWHLARQTGARLTLSGHTHGGQINLIPGLSSALIMGKYARGLYRRKGQVLYVSRGLGVVAIPVRIGAPPEITLITLRKG